jgi:sporulation protein YhbH
MSLPWELRRRGLKDSLRHDQRVKEAMRKNLRELIIEESIITSDGTKNIRIPMRYLEQYRFKYGHPQAGVGQGQGQPGDAIGRGAGDGAGPGDGRAGEQSGEHTYEVEVPLEELTQLMLEDLALPWLEEKPQRQVTSTTHRYTDVRRRGAMANLDKRRTLLTNLKRNAARGHPQVDGLNDADLRFKVWETHEETHAQAAVYMLMDCSASMTTSKKYIAKSFFFWMVRFLRLKYQRVATVFIPHDVQAVVVPEAEFFTLSSAGGTRCSSAYQMALEHLLEHHPASHWNTYLLHFSDGDNLPDDNATCKRLIEALLDHCRMVGYSEIRYQDDASFYGWMGQTTASPSSLQNVLQAIEHPRFLNAMIRHKEELYQVLQTFLQPRESAHV